jgi:hypothetical protein
MNVDQFYFVDTYESRHPARKGKDSGIVTLPGIEMQHQIPRGVYLKDLGEVGSLRKAFVKERLRLEGVIQDTRNLVHRALDGSVNWADTLFGIPEWALENTLGAMGEGLAKLEAGDAFAEKWPDIDTLRGGCVQEKIDDTRRAFIMAVKAGLSESSKIFTQGHESAEYLDEITGGRNELQAELDRFGIKLNVADLEGEQFADCGGLLALKKAADSGVKGISVPKFKNPRPWLDELKAYFGF